MSSFERVIPVNDTVSYNLTYFFYHIFFLSVKNWNAQERSCILYNTQCLCKHQTCSVHYNRWRTGVPVTLRCQGGALYKVPVHVYQELKRYFRDPGFDLNIVRIRETARILDGIRDLTAAREAGFAEILARDAVLGKKTVFWVEITEVRGEELSWKSSENAGSGGPPHTLKNSVLTKHMKTKLDHTFYLLPG